MNGKEILYFAYGSNLDREDLMKWGGRKGYSIADIEGIVAGEIAWLPDYEMRFHFYSYGRGGGAADVVKGKVGQAVPGQLFSLDQIGQKMMEIKEGSPYFYHQKWVNVVTEGGEIIEALTYTVNPSRIENKFVKPSDEYVYLIRNSLMKLNLPTNMLDAALNPNSYPGGNGKENESKEDSSTLDKLFTYGTLMEGGCRHDIIQKKPLCIGTVKGQLMNCGQFPGLQRKEKGIVSGELYESKKMLKLLERLDLVEGFKGWSKEGSLFSRSIIKVKTGGGEIWAWTYLLIDEKAIAASPVIESGNWKTR